MKILWVTNISLKDPNISSGSWLENLSSGIEETGEVDIYYCSPSSETSIIYYNLNEKDLNVKFLSFLKKGQFDLVHIHGTEIKHTLDFVKACKDSDTPFAISIQGLVSIIANHLSANLPSKVIRGKTIRNILLNDSVKGLSKTFKANGELEREALRLAEHVIGRTTWDKAMVNEVNDTVNYYHCNEVLREEFYTNEKWDFDGVEEHTIFVSQASYSLKGFHYLLWALPSIIVKYPDVKVIVSGKNMLKTSSLQEKIKETYYAKYIQKFIKENKLSDYIKFTGKLNAEQMKSQYLKSNVFVSLSTMENESNSVSEAKILGVPVVSSYVGGVIDRIEHGVDGYLYQHDSPEMLAYYIKKVFEDTDKTKVMSDIGRSRAQVMFDKKANVERIINVYNTVINAE